MNNIVNSAEAAIFDLIRALKYAKIKRLQDLYPKLRLVARCAVGEVSDIAF